MRSIESEIPKEDDRAPLPNKAARPHRTPALFNSSHPRGRALPSNPPPLLGMKIVLPGQVLSVVLTRLAGPKETRSEFHPPKKMSRIYRLNLGLEILQLKTLKF